MSEGEKVVSNRKRKAQESWSSKKKEKKSEPEAVDDDVPINPLVGEAPKKPKQKTVSTTTEDGENVVEEKKPEKKKRFILFMGNLSYKTTIEDITAHIAPTGVKPTAVRLQTDAVTAKPKGFAFIDLPDFTSLDKVLNLHHTQLGGRKINIELTAGGGGSGDKRKAKIMKKNEKLGVERETAMKTKRDAEAKKVKEARTRGTPNGEKTSRDQDMSDVNPARRRRIK